MVIERDWVTAWADGVALSVTLTVKSAAPAAVGVPEIAPEPAFRLRPGGSARAVTFQVYGEMPPAAVRVAV